MFYFSLRRWFRRLENKVDALMASFEDLQTVLNSVANIVTNVKADTDTLLAKITELQSNPPSGMTPEQQAALDVAVSTAQGIVTALGAVDDLVPNAPAPTEEQPAPEQPVVE